MSIIRLGNFVNELGRVIKSNPAEPELLQEARNLMHELVSHDDWLPDQYAIAHPDTYQQYLLYCDEQKRFSVVSFVWGPGQKTPVHDHTVWGVIGILRGLELSQRYVFDDSGTLNPTEQDRLLPGDVDLVSPSIGDIHEVSNGLDDQDSISIHLYGANIGEVERHVYAVPSGEKKSFVSGYVNSDTPDIWQEN